MNSEVEKRLALKLEVRKEKDTFRTLSINHPIIDFSSNDYLGFATDSLLQLNEFNIPSLSGAKASRLITGNSLLHENVEKQIAQFHHAETGLIFNSGYDANIGLIGCIAQKGDTIIYDELCHASILDGLKLSLGNAIAYKHNNISDLASKLSQTQGQTFIVTEGIFSMDGDESPLTEIVSVCKKYKSAIIIDEAHSNGIIGKNGRGLVCKLGLEKKIFARVHTFGKAIGCHGAIVLGSNTLRNYLINYARSFVFTTAIPPHSLIYLQNAYKELASTNRIELLNNKIDLFHNHLQIHVKSKLLPSQSPIQSLIIKGASNTRKIALTLQEKGFDVKPIVAPTVQHGHERIRICIHAFNSNQNIIALAKMLNQIISIEK